MAPEDPGGAEDGPADPATGASDSGESIRQAPAGDESDDSGESSETDDSSATGDFSGTDDSSATGDSSGTDDTSATGNSSRTRGSSDPGGRDVEVPMRVYKTVTVFSTLFAVVFVLAGFLLLDRATDRATASLSEVDPVLAILGLLGIVAGAAVYAFGTRFRAEGMGTPKDRPDESPDDE